MMKDSKIYNVINAAGDPYLIVLKDLNTHIFSGIKMFLKFTNVTTVYVSVVL